MIEIDGTKRPDVKYLEMVLSDLRKGFETSMSISGTGSHSLKAHITSSDNQVLTIENTVKSDYYYYYYYYFLIPRSVS